MKSMITMVIVVMGAAVFYCAPRPCILTTSARRERSTPGFFFVLHLALRTSSLMLVKNIHFGNFC